jgi:acetyl-CoA/propionyl-CoA carboxylase biotin carboxyl carrier protein
LIEEAPADNLAPGVEQAMGEAAIKAAKAVGYYNAGTVEFIYQDGEFFFLEMNTRLQVEHPVTEVVTGIDLVEWQIRVASGEPLPMTQEEVTASVRGHGIEVRINAENPAGGKFLPSPGTLSRLVAPNGFGLRFDAGYQSGDTISQYYDNLIGKLIVWAPDRDRAIDRMLRALSEFEIEGVRSLVPLHIAVLEHPEFAAGGTMREFVEGGGYQRSIEPQPPEAEGLNGAAPLTEPRTLVTEVDGKRFEVTVLEPEHPGRTRLRQRLAQLAERSARRGGGVDVVHSPMQGTVLTVSVEAGGEVAPGQVLVIVEAMKMENEIVARRSGTVESVSVAEGDQVTSGQELLRLDG